MGQTGYRSVDVLLLVLMLLGNEAPSGSASSELTKLLKQLESQDPAMRADAAFRLGAIGRAASPAVPALLKVIGDNRNVSKVLYRTDSAALAFGPQSVGIVACEALGNIGDKRATEPLCNFMLDKRNDSKWREREAAAKALGALGDPRAIGPLIQVLCDADILAPRERAGDSIAKIGAPAVGPLVDLVNRGDKNRQVAVTLLGRIGPPAINPLTKMLNSKDMQLAKQAAVALGTIPDVEALRALAGALKKGNPSMRTTIVEVFSRFCHSQDLGSLGSSPARQRGRSVVATATDQHADPNVQRGLAFILVLQDEVVGTAITILNEPSDKVSARMAAIWILLFSQDPRAVEPLVKALGDRDKDIRKHALSAICQLAHLTRFPKPRLDELDPANKDRWAKNQIDLLAELKAKAVAPLIQCVGDKTRAGSVSALHELTGKAFKTKKEWQDWWNAESGKSVSESPKPR